MASQQAGKGRLILFQVPDSLNKVEINAIKLSPESGKQHNCQYIHNFYIRDDRAVASPTDHIDGESSEGWSPIQGSFWRAGGIAPGLELKDVRPRFTKEAVEVIVDHSGNDAHKTFHRHAIRQRVDGDPLRGLETDQSAWFWWFFSTKAHRTRAW